MKYLAIISFYLLIFNSSSAQSIDWVWAKGSDNCFMADGAHSVATDASGNVFVAGYFWYSQIAFGNTPMLLGDDLYDMFLVKYDSNGDELWAKNASGDGYEGPNSVAIDAAGNVYVVGYFDGPSITFETTTLTTLGMEDIFIAKYDTDGNLLWAKSFGGADNERANAITIDNSGNIFVVGFYESSSIVFGSDTLINSDIDDEDIFLVKFDANGDAIWVKSAVGNSDDIAEAVTTDATGNIYVTGYSSTQNFTLGTWVINPSGGDNVFTVKYDANGNEIWAASVGGSGRDNGLGIAADDLGNCYITGLWDSGDDDMFIEKYNTSGIMDWWKLVGGSSDDRATSLIINGTDLYVTGHFASSTIIFDTDTLVNAGSTDIFVTKYDLDGNVQWAKQAGGSNADHAFGINMDASEDLYVVGRYRSSPAIFGSISLPNTGGSEYDVFVAKLGAPVVPGVENAKNQQDFNIYPNPNTGIFTLEIEGITSEGFKLVIVNYLGQQVFVETLDLTPGKYSKRIDLSGYSQGVYFVKLQGANSIKTERVVTY